MPAGPLFIYTKQELEQMKVPQEGSFHVNDLRLLYGDLGILQEDMRLFDHLPEIGVAFTHFDQWVKTKCSGHTGRRRRQPPGSSGRRT